MWTIIKKENLQNFVNEHKEAITEENLSRIILLETKNVYVVPRYLSNYFPSKYLEIYTGKNNNQFDRCKFNFVKTLYEHQIPIVNRVLNIYKEKGFVNGIIKARPGVGKTVIAVYLSAKLGYRTLIIVPSEVIMKQWLRAIHNFTDLGPNNIGIFKSNLNGLDKPICVSMVQTILARIKKDFVGLYKLIDSSNFGLVIYDEVHSTSASEKFSKTSVLFRTKNILGLSATPFHNPIQEIVMKSTIGEIIFNHKQYDFTPRYDLVYYHSNISEKVLKRALYGIRDYIRLKAFYNAQLKTEDYLKTILKLTKELLAENHKILIIVITISQVELISKYLEDNGIPNRKFCGIDREELDIKNYNVVIGTKAFCGEGFDEKELSALILASPFSGKKSLIQLIGRILRESSNKRSPVVKDLIDLSFPQLFMNEVKIKKSIIATEFGSEINEIFL